MIFPGNKITTLNHPYFALVNSYYLPLRKITDLNHPCFFLIALIKNNHLLNRVVIFYNCTRVVMKKYHPVKINISSKMLKNAKIGPWDIDLVITVSVGGKITNRSQTGMIMCGIFFYQGKSLYRG